MLAGLILSLGQAQAASQQVLIVSINRVVPPAKIQTAVQRLERVDLFTGTCFFTAKVSNYIPYDQTAPYHGVALVEVNENCAADRMKKYISWLKAEQKKGTYTLYSNSPIEPGPGIGGRN